MSDKEVLESLVKDLLVQKDVSEQMSNFHKLSLIISSCNVQDYEKEFNKIIKTHLNSGNLDLQKCALTFLNICLSEQTGKQKGHLFIDLALDIVEIAYNGKTDSVEDQELWLTTFTSISLLEDIFNELCIKKTTHMISILTKSLSPMTTSVQKEKALQMFNMLLLNIKIGDVEKNVNELLISAWWKCIFPITFNTSSSNLQKEALICVQSMLPYVHVYLKNSNQLWDEIGTELQKTYIPLLAKLIEEGHEIYRDLWVYLIKLVVQKINKGLPVVNSLLSVIESAFKSHNLTIRRLAFSCWQVLIECISLDVTADYGKRIRLLTIPLKTNNCKTEELVDAKFSTWFTLFKVLIAKNACSPVGVLDLFLNFCFGPLCDTPLESYSNVGLMSAGKKYSKFHPTSCKALLQIVGVRKYIDDDLYAEMQKFPIFGTILTAEGFIKISKLVIYSVGECSVLLSGLENEDAQSCAVKNEAIWKSLFYIIDSQVECASEKSKIVEHVTRIVIAMTCLGRKKPNVVEFCVLPVYDIIVSGEFKFFQDDVMYDLLFLPLIYSILKKDKALLRPDMIAVFEKIFRFKRNCPTFVAFLESFIKRLTIAPRTELAMEKLQALHSLWYLIETELLLVLETLKRTQVDENLLVSVFYAFLYWPLPSLHRLPTEELVSKWKDIFDKFGECTSNGLRIKLAHILMKEDLCSIVEKKPDAVVLAELIKHVIVNLNVQDCPEDCVGYVYVIYCCLKNIVALRHLSADTLDVYQSCVSHVLETCSTFPYLHRVIQPMTDCLDSILSQHQKTGILSAVHTFFKRLNYSDNLESTIVSMVDILKSLPTVTVELTRMIVSAESLIKIKTKETGSSEKSREECDKTGSKHNKQRINLLGHDVDTMTPVKSKDIAAEDNCTPKQLRGKTKGDDDFVFVDTPYKFDRRKLTKSQKIKLSRRRDDIPALYQDLSQSQSQNVNTNSESFAELITTDGEQQKETAKETAEGEKDCKENMETEEIAGETQSFADISKTIYPDVNMEENADVNTVASSSLETTPTNPVASKRRRRKCTGHIKKVPNRRNKTIVDYSEIIFPRHKKCNLNKAVESLEETGVVSDTEILRRRTSQSKSLYNKSKKEGVKVTENGQKEHTESVETEKLSAKVQPFADFSKSLQLKSNGEGTTEPSSFQNTSLQVTGKKPGLVRRGRRKSTGFIKSSAQEQDSPTMDYSGMIFSDCEKGQSGSYSVGFIDDKPFSDNETIRRRVRKELQRIKIDVNHSEEYKNINTKRRTRSDSHTLKWNLRSKNAATSPENTEISSIIDLDNDDVVSESPEKQAARGKALITPAEIPVEPVEMVDNRKPVELTEMETDSEPVIDSSQDREISLKPCKIVALHQFQKIKPGEHLVINDCQSMVDLVVKGPKLTSPFKVINQSGLNTNNNNETASPTISRKIEFSPLEGPQTISVPALDETDAKHQEKQNNVVSEVVVMVAENNDLFIDTESNNIDESCLSPFRINSDTTNLSLDTTNCEAVDVRTETDLVEIRPDDTTISVNTQLLAELDSGPDNEPVENPPNEDVCRKVVLNTSDLSDESVLNDKVSDESDLDSTPLAERINGIVTSPICNDTPTRNSEFIRSTEEISPIRDVPNNDSDPTFVNTDTVNGSLTLAGPEVENGIDKNEKEISPMLFSDSCDVDVVNNQKESKSTPNSFIINKNKSKYLSRGSQMMDMVSANTPQGASASKKKKIVLKPVESKQCFTPTQNRISKIMTQFERVDNQENNTEGARDKINHADIFNFSKKLPLPTCSPSTGILKKRKFSEIADDEPLLANKRKRVNFSDPEVTSRKFIEKSGKFKYTSNHRLVDIIPQEPRVTRSSSNDSGESRKASDTSIPSTSTSAASTSAASTSVASTSAVSTTVTSTSATSTAVASTTVASTSAASTDIASTSAASTPSTSIASASTPSAITAKLPTESINNIFNERYIDNLFSNFTSEDNNANINYNKTLPICENLVTCTDQVECIVPKLTTPNFYEAITSLLHGANIRTVADIAKLTEFQVHELPLQVDKVRSALTDYCIEPFEHLFPSNRQPPPVNLSALARGRNDIRTKSVIIPLGWKEPVMLYEVDIKSESSDFDSSMEESEILSDHDYNIQRAPDSVSPGASIVIEDDENPNISTRINYSSDNSQNSSSQLKDGILDEEISGVKIHNLITSVIHLLNDKKFDPKPLVQLLFSGYSNLTNLIVSMGILKVHHLANGQKWEDIISEIITNIGIWKLMQYLCEMQNVPHSVILETVIKYNLEKIGYEFLCNQLNIVELLQCISRNYDLSEILKQFDTGAIFGALLDLCTNTKHNILQIKDMICDLYLVVIGNPPSNSPITEELCVWQFGENVITKLETSSMDKFVERIYKSVCKVDITISQLSVQEDNIQISNNNTSEDMALSVVHSISDGTMSKNVQNLLLQALVQNMTGPELTEFFARELQKKF